ncbi:MAG: glycosyltransferase, partial [Candidatus Goldbacteria bacterium]|nr:glycosyltransferase [Candidatus Goldiibacteriota bacterium]
MNSQKRVCAIVVTYNRKNLLIECLEALRKQTKVLDGIYIIDNCSTDGTAELLKELGYISRVPPAGVDGVWEDEYRVRG